MLVLSRRVHEKIVFPDVQATLEVAAIHAGNVRLGFEAPAELRVFREEVWERTREEWAGPTTPPRNSGEQDPAGLCELRCRWQMVANALLSLIHRGVRTGRAREMERIVDTLDRELSSLCRQA